MAAQMPSPQSAQPPPDVPFDPKLSDITTDYLRRFSLWCRNGFSDSIRARSAAPGLLISSWDTAPGSTPKVFMLRVSEAGAISVLPTEIGGDLRKRSIGSGP